MSSTILNSHRELTLTRVVILTERTPELYVDATTIDIRDAEELT
jgi:hypothetical protein